MRLAINVTRDSDPRVIEEDVEIALGKLLQDVDFDIEEQDTGTFTADTTDIVSLPDDFHFALEGAILADTGAEVTVEIIEGWPPSGYQSDQGFSGKRMGAPGEGIHSGFSRGAGPSGKGS